MHSYMHFRKNNKTKIKFHAFIYAFFKNNKTKKIKFHAFINTFLKKNRKNKVACIQTCIFIQNKIKKNQSSIHMCIIQKRTKIKNSHSSKVSCIQICIFKKNIIQNSHSSKFQTFKHTFSFKLKIQIQSKTLCILKKNNNKKSNFIDSNMHFQIQLKISCIHQAKKKISCILICIFQNQKLIFKQISCTQTCIFHSENSQSFMHS